MMQHASVSKGQREATDLNALVSEHIDLAYHGKQAQMPDLKVEIERDLEAGWFRQDLITLFDLLQSIWGDCRTTTDLPHYDEQQSR